MLLTVTYVASFNARTESAAVEQFRQIAHGWKMVATTTEIKFIKSEEQPLIIKEGATE